MVDLLSDAKHASQASIRGPFVSAVLHGSAVLLLVLGATKVPRVVPVRSPGSANGKHMLLTFSTGAQTNVVASTVARQAAPAVEIRAKEVASPTPPVAESKPMAERGSGAGGLSGLGNGNMTIAALKVSPRPKPDLSTLPFGGGNIILNAIIDTNGLISELTVMQSLSASIDQQVMATVKGWSFIPATKDGQPVVCEQEIVLHYERV